MVLPDDIRLTRGFYLVRHQDDARVARINRMAEVVVELDAPGAGLGRDAGPHADRNSSC